MGDEPYAASTRFTQSAEERFVVSCVHLDPVFVGHTFAPFQKSSGVRSYGVTQLPAIALGDL
jgi:hypothetical protein